MFINRATHTWDTSGGKRLVNFIFIVAMVASKLYKDVRVCFSVIKDRESLIVSCYCLCCMWSDYF